MSNMTHASTLGLIFFFASTIVSSQTLFSTYPKNHNHQCQFTDNPGCSYQWDDEISGCTLKCISTPILPNHPSEPVPSGGSPTGPAPAGTNNKVALNQIVATIKNGTHAERARLANSLATPLVSQILSSKTPPVSPENLPPDSRELLRIIRDGSIKERSMVGEKIMENQRN